MVDQIKLIKSYQQNKINLTDVHLLERIKSFIFILLFLNFSIWSSFHSSHHLIANQNLDPKFEEFDQVHVHHDGKVHEHGKTSLPNHKKHQEQSDFGCVLLNFNSACEENLLFSSIKIIIDLKEITKDKIFTKIFLNKSKLLLSEINPRGSPI